MKRKACYYDGRSYIRGEETCRMNVSKYFKFLSGSADDLKGGRCELVSDYHLESFSKYILYIIIFSSKINKNGIFYTLVTVLFHV